MKTSGAVFQCLMDFFWGPSAKNCCDNYWQHHNFLPYARTTSWGCELRFGKTQDSKLRGHTIKCAFVKEEVVLEFNVFKEGKTQIFLRSEINDLRPPKKVNGVKKTLGMLNFYQKLIPNFAMLAEPIVKSTRGKMRKNSSFKWDQRHNKCLSLLKDKL